MRQIVHLNDKVCSRLKNYTSTKYPGRRALSLVVQIAIVRFLDEEEGKSGKAKGKQPARTRII